MDRESYERDLAERQRKHLEQVSKQNDGYSWQPCLHDQCPQCIGTGVKIDGSPCYHLISCPCPKCRAVTTYYSTSSTGENKDT